MQPNASKHSKSTAGIRTSPRRSRTCKATKSIWPAAARWCSTRWSRSKMRSIQRSLSVDRVARASVAHVQWTLAAPTRSHASARSTALISTSRWRFIHCRICMWWRILCLTWITSTSSIDRFSLGCSESESDIIKILCHISTQIIFIIVATSPPSRKAKLNTCSRSTIAPSLTACTSAFCALAARHRVPRTGGTATSISAQPCSCKPTVGSSTRAMSRPKLVWTTCVIHSVSIGVIRSWIAHVRVPRAWIRAVPSLRLRNCSAASLKRDSQAWRQRLCTSKSKFLLLFLWIFVRLKITSTHLNATCGIEQIRVWCNFLHSRVN